MNTHSFLITNVLTILTAVFLLSACEEPNTAQNTKLDCGTGTIYETGGSTYCVYSKKLIIEGFECPQSMYRHDITNSDITVCGEMPMEPPQRHADDILEWFNTQPDNENPCNLIDCAINEECRYDPDTNKGKCVPKTFYSCGGPEKKACEFYSNDQNNLNSSYGYCIDSNGNSCDPQKSGCKGNCEYQSFGGVDSVEPYLQCVYRKNHFSCITCNGNKPCEGGSFCVNDMGVDCEFQNPGGSCTGYCFPTEDRCSFVTCMPNFSCEVQNEQATCIPMADAPCGGEQKTVCGGELICVTSADTVCDSQSETCSGTCKPCDLTCDGDKICQVQNNQKVCLGGTCGGGTPEKKCSGGQRCINSNGDACDENLSSCDGTCKDDPCALMECADTKTCKVQNNQATCVDIICGDITGHNCPTGTYCDKDLTCELDCEGTCKTNPCASMTCNMGESCLRTADGTSAACVPDGTCAGPNKVVCKFGEVCLDDPADMCDPSNGGVDCVGSCVRRCWSGTSTCDLNETCVDEPNDMCDPNNGGVGCIGGCQST